MTSRREFVTLLGGGAAAWPLAARAQQFGQVRRVGVLVGYAESDLMAQHRISAFQRGLQELGWREGHNIRLDVRFAAADPDRMQAYATAGGDGARRDPCTDNSNYSGAAPAVAHDPNCIRDRLRSGWHSR